MVWIDFVNHLSGELFQKPNMFQSYRKSKQNKSCQKKWNQATSPVLLINYCPFDIIQPYELMFLQLMPSLFHQYQISGDDVGKNAPLFEHQ